MDAGVDSAAIAADTPAGRGPALTVGGARRVWAQKFRGCGIDSPDLDARILVGHALGLDRSAVARADSRRLTSEEEDAIAVLARRRLRREPVARIIGMKEFWSLPLTVDAATLVPRPETETVVEAALVAVDAGGGRSRTLRVADLGTGSGAILLALLSELPNAFGVGSDVSVPALCVASRNARRVGVASAHFVACDMAAAISGTFDIVVSNPPYVASGGIAALSPEVRDFDPWRALDGGPDGLQFYRTIAAAASRLLAPGGALAVEIGIGQAQAVAAILAAAGLAPSPPRSDLNDVPRTLVAKRA